MAATVAPWALSVGLLVSFTAAAGHDPSAGVSLAALAPGPAELGAALVPATRALALGATPLRLDVTGVLRERSLDADLGGLAPLGDLKPGSRPFPTIDHARKGDPAGPAVPSLSRLASAAPAPGPMDAMRLVFSRDERLLPPTVLMPGSVQTPDLLAGQSLEPWPEGEGSTTLRATAAQSPSARGTGGTGAGRGAVTPTADGATPAVPRALALASTTPAPADATPLLIAAAPVTLPQGGLATLRPDRPAEGATARLDPKGPRYADLVDPAKMDREQRCLAEAVYFEARSEPEEGQAAVAQVVLNRVRSGLYPTSICGVVYQNRHRHLACQFTFACEGKSLRITDGESWRSATRVAEAVLQGKTYLADVGAATHYHADYVRPRWAKRLKKMDVIGRHIFYKLRPGQT